MIASQRPLPTRSGLREGPLSGDQVSPPPSCRKADVPNRRFKSGPDRPMDRVEVGYTRA